VIRSHELPTPLVWIEHRPKESTSGTETFELVIFSSYEVEERTPYLGGTGARIGGATWKRLGRASVEVLVGGESVERGKRRLRFRRGDGQSTGSCPEDQDYLIRPIKVASICAARGTKISHGGANSMVIDCSLAPRACLQGVGLCAPFRAH
jgi:hypothetical protein